MNNLITKIASLYSTPHIKYKYKIAYHADLFAMLLTNIVGLIWLAAPVVLLITMIINTPFSHYSMITLDHFMALCLFNFFYFGLSFGFFIHNKHKIFSHIMLFGFSWMGLALVVMILNAIYHLGRVNYNLITKPSEHQWVLNLDLALLATAGIIYLCNSKKISAFFDKHLTKF